ncbi:MAG TPA: sigma-70 family RNA polymerase sigma factor [Oceanipulchritudo sp.]|nr:sigma-70 family RNA polymerase sigma factor [Oceanipulchritudo sp.]
MVPSQHQSYPDDNSPNEITRILQSAKAGSNQTDALIPLVYDELHRIAACRLAAESPGQTLQATALVHEAYLRLLSPKSTWHSRRHFFGAAAEAMRRILIETARRKGAQKRGGDQKRDFVEIEHIPENEPEVDVLDLNEALQELEQQDPEAAELVKLRYFAGLTMRQIALAMEISPRTAGNIWAFAKAWLYRRLN